MTAKKTDAELSTDTKKATTPASKATARKGAELSTGYNVVDGVSITTKRGTLSNGSRIEARDLSGGQAALDALIKAKNVVKL